MRRLAFKQVLDQIALLGIAQRSALVNSLRVHACGERVVHIIETARRASLAGPRSGGQRFRCTHCARTFNSLSGTPMARLRHQAQWLDYGACPVTWDGAGPSMAGVASNRRHTSAS